MPRLAISLTPEQREALEQSGIDIAELLKDTVKAKMEDMIRVSERNIDDVPGRVKRRVGPMVDLPDIPDPHREMLKQMKNQGRLNFIDFVGGKFNQVAEAIVRAELHAGPDFVTITPPQEAFLLCDMGEPEEWINNAIQVKADKLLAGIGEV